MRGRVLSVIFGVFLLWEPAPSSASDWAQMRGGGDHAGHVDLEPSPLDVLDAYTVLETDMSLGLHVGLLATPVGLMADWRTLTGSQCGFVTLTSLASREFRSSEPDGCPAVAPEVFGYDAQKNLLLMCQGGQSGDLVVVARNATTLDAVWSVTSERLGAASTGSEAGAVTGWHCTAGAIDGTSREAVVGLHSPRSSRGIVASLSLDDGAVRWARGTSGSALAGAGILPDMVPDPETNPVGDVGFEADEVTLTRTGVAVGGDVEDSVQAALWLDRGGNIIGGAAAQATQTSAGPETTTARSRSGAWASNGGDLAAIILDRRLLVVNPEAPEMTQIPLDTQEPLDESIYPWPARWDDFLVAPLTHTVYAYKGNDFQLAWDWYHGTTWRISDVIIAPPLDAYILATHEVSDGHEAILVRVDLATGYVAQQLPLPVEPAVSSVLIEGVQVRRWFAELLPAPDGGVVVADTDGQVVRLGLAEPSRRPLLAVSSDYPKPREEFVVRPQAAPGTSPVRFMVQWGSGPLEDILPGEEARTQFAAEGIRTLRVTAVFTDGRTATTEHLLDVGGSPPPTASDDDLNFIQRAFARENQDLTFGVLGLAVALGGGLLAFGRGRRRRRLVRRELEAIENSVASAGGAPERLEAALTVHRAKVRELGLAGKLDHAGTILLDRRLDELARQARLDVLENEFGFLTVGMARTLRGMLADARISSWERAHMLEAVDRASDLTPDQRARVRLQIEAWFEQDRKETVEPGSHRAR